jgi:DNA (cytosine-5)-methyltransferase 1
MKMKVLDCFAGIGGFSLGLERTGGFETAAFVEINSKAQKVLQKHWPSVPVFSDIKTITRERLEAEGLIGYELLEAEEEDGEA